MMRLVPQEEIDAETKLLNEWWEGLDHIQKHTVTRYVKEMKEIPNAKELCLRDHYIGTDANGIKMNAFCMNTRPCKDHGKMYG